MICSIGSSYSKFNGSLKPHDLPGDLLGWTLPDLEAHRAFVERQLMAQIEEPRGSHDWPRVGDPRRALDSFRKDFEALLDTRSAALGDYFKVIRSSAEFYRRLLPETPRVHASVVDYGNPGLPWHRHRLSVLIDRLSEVSGRPELDSVDWHAFSSCRCAIRRLGMAPPMAPKRWLRLGFLSGLRPFESACGYQADSLASRLDSILSVSPANKTNHNKLRLEIAGRDAIVVPNTRAARRLLVQIRRSWWRVIQFAIAGQLDAAYDRVFCDAAGFARPCFGLTVSDGETLLVQPGAASNRPDRRSRHSLAGRIPLEFTESLLGFQHPRLIAARAMLFALQPHEASVIESALGPDGAYKRLDAPVAAPCFDWHTLSDQEQQFIEPFESEGGTMYRVYTFGSFRDFPVTELPSLSSARAFLAANCTTAGIRVGLEFRPSVAA